jgi:hypothetical protein
MNQAGTSATDLVTRARNGDQQAWDAPGPHPAGHGPEAGPPPLPGQTPPSSGHRRPDQRRPAAQLITQLPPHYRR